MERSRPSILVIDDDPGIRHLIALAVTGSGYDVVETDGAGIEALQGDYAAVLLDVRLGERSASDVLRAAPWLERRPLIVMTAGPEDREALARLPDHTLLPKPFDLTTLDDAIATARAGDD
jgi:DNA-binding response OmpR family regulator